MKKRQMKTNPTIARELFGHCTQPPGKTLGQPTTDNSVDDANTGWKFYLATSFVSPALNAPCTSRWNHCRSQSMFVGDRRTQHSSRRTSSGPWSE